MNYFLVILPVKFLFLKNIKKVVEEVGDDMTETQIRQLLERAKQNGKDMIYKEFHDIMTKNAKLNL